MVTVGSDHIIIGANRRFQTNSYRFLTNVEVKETGKFLLHIELTRAFFKLADQEHLLVPLQQQLFVVSFRFRRSMG